MFHRMGPLARFRTDRDACIAHDRSVETRTLPDNHSLLHTGASDQIIIEVMIHLDAQRVRS